MSFWLPLAMAGVGAAKGVMDQGDARAEAKTQAEIARYSPWSGMQPQQVQKGDPFGAAMQGGMAGMGLSQSMDAAGQANEFQKQQLQLQKQQADAQNNYLQSMTPPRM